MKYEINLVVSPIDAANEQTLKTIAAKHVSISSKTITFIKTLKRSIDARSRSIKINLRLEIYTEQTIPPEINYKIKYPDVSNKKSVIVVGAGPAGLFAALQLIEKGLKPIIIERGKDVKSRRRDLAAINKEHLVNSHSNYCFGEGGAGTYSDGKLYTRSTKRGDVTKVLEIFVAHGADENILIEAHPHIGTNKLPKIIEAMRQTILNNGGEMHFQTHVVDLLIKNQAVQGVRCSQVESGKTAEFIADSLILATGHSARDIFELLHSKHILLEEKTIAMGVRVEHPQALIDSLQYHCTIAEVENQRNYLPAASYSMVHQAMERGVYSFCMCPGGIIAPCATAQEEVVTNGWSPSKRNNPFANSGIVVTVEPEDYKKYSSQGPLAGLRYQQALERMAWEAGGKTQTAPAQRLQDFVMNKFSSSLPPASYQPGLRSAPLHDLLPPEIGKRLQLGFVEFGKKMRGYLSNDAVIVGVESRTSSPVRIPRDPLSLQHPQIKGLYPCGEGAGYAGGIVSAAIDGQNVQPQLKPASLKSLSLIAFKFNYSYRMDFLIRLIISTLAVLISSYLLPGVSIEGNSFFTALIVATVLAFLNAVVKPIMIILTIPITVFTLGFFLLVINACMILIATKLVPGFHVNGFLWALLFSLILSLVTSILEGIKKSDDNDTDE